MCHTNVASYPSVSILTEGKPAEVAPMKSHSPLKDFFSSPIGGSIISAVVIGFLTAPISIYIGTRLEQQKAVSEERKIYLEHRMKLWVSTATHFPQYIINLRRLRTHAQVRLDRTLSNDELELMKKAVADRNHAREGLYGDLAQAKFFFSDAVKRQIEEFEEFDAKNVDLSVTRDSKLPAIKEWEDRQTAILAAIRREFDNVTSPDLDRNKLH